MRYFLAVALWFVLVIGSFGQYGDMPLSDILMPGEAWQLVPAKVKSASSLTADAKGRVYVADRDDGKIIRIGNDTHGQVFANHVGTISELRCGPGGRLVALKEVRTSGTHGANKEIISNLVAYDAKGKETLLVDGIAGAHLAVGPRTGRLYLSGAKKESRTWGIYLLDAETGNARLSGHSILERSADLGDFALSPDEGTVAAVVDFEGWLHAFRVEPDGSLRHEQPYWSLRRARPARLEVVSNPIYDRDGRLYAASESGIQVFDPTGRLSGVLLYPTSVQHKDLEHKLPLTFGGAGFDHLYLALGNKIFVRALKSKGVPPPQ